MAKKKIAVTNAMRLLSAAKVAYETIEYETEEGMLDHHFGAAIAEVTGLNPNQSFKTLVARGEKTGVLVCCVPVCREVDLKKLAKAAGEKKVEMIPVRELLGLTGYIRGSVSPIGMKKKYPTYIDASCLEFERIAVSGGVCGIALLLQPEELVSVTGAITAPITAEKE